MKSKKFFRLKEKALAKSAALLVEMTEVPKEESETQPTLPEVVVESQEETPETSEKKKVASKKK